MRCASSSHLHRSGQHAKSESVINTGLPKHCMIGYVDQCQPLLTMALTQSFGKYVIQSAIFSVARAVAMAFWLILPVGAALVSTPNSCKSTEKFRDCPVSRFYD